MIPAFFIERIGDLHRGYGYGWYFLSMGWTYRAVFLLLLPLLEYVHSTTIEFTSDSLSTPRRHGRCMDSGKNYKHFADILQEMRFGFLM